MSRIKRGVVVVFFNFSQKKKNRKTKNFEKKLGIDLVLFIFKIK
jgi:hypothetical protein